MAQQNDANDRIRLDYIDFLKVARGRSEGTIDACLKAIRRLEESTGFKDFKKFHIQQAIAFSRRLEAERNERGQPLSQSTIRQTMDALRNFFVWLAGQHGYKQRIRYSDAEYFRISERGGRIARAQRSRPIATIEQLNAILSAMPATSEIERRDRAVFALTLLTGMRDGAPVTLKVKHVDLVEGKVHQDAREVATKFGKTFTTWFVPVGEIALDVVHEWVTFLQADKLFSYDDPLFPATTVEPDKNGEFAAVGLSRSHWSNADPVRAIFKAACAGAGMEYFHPHSVRHSLTQFAFRLCSTPEEFKAFSQNIGHSQALTTLQSYGNIPEARQAELIRKLGRGKDEDALGDGLLKEFAAFMEKRRRGGG
jgi:integrase